jgi:hypothetical protein
MLTWDQSISPRCRLAYSVMGSFGTSIRLTWREPHALQAADVMNPGYKIEKTVGTGTAGTSVMDLMGMMYNIIRGSLMGSMLWACRTPAVCGFAPAS